MVNVSLLLQKIKEKLIEGKFEVGRGYTGSGRLGYGGALYVYNKETGEFEYSEYPVKWTWISKLKRVGEAIVRVPVGTIIKHVLFRRKGRKVAYYLATEEGFKKIPYETKTKVIEKVGEHEIIARCNELQELGVEDCWLFYVKGSLSPVLQPSFESEIVEEWKSKLEKAERILDSIRAKLTKLTGYEPVKFWVRRHSVCVKLPFLGKEEFKKMVKKYQYDYSYSCFEIPSKNFVDEFKKLRDIGIPVSTLFLEYPE